MESVADEDPQDGDDFNPEDEIEEVEDFDEANLENDIEEVEEEEEEDEEEEDEEGSRRRVDTKERGGKSEKQQLESNTRKGNVVYKAGLRPSKSSDQGHSLSDEEDYDDLSSDSDRRMDDDDDDDDDDEAAEVFSTDDEGTLDIEKVAQGMTVVNMSRKKTTMEDEEAFVDICSVDDEEDLGMKEKNADSPKKENGKSSINKKDPAETIVIDDEDSGASRPVDTTDTPGVDGEEDKEEEMFRPGIIYRLDEDSMSEEKAKVIKERVRRNELLFYYKTLQAGLQKPNTPLETNLWPKQLILQRATDSIAVLKQNDSELELELETEMQKNYVLKKKLRDQEILSTIKRMKEDSFKRKAELETPSRKFEKVEVKKVVPKPSKTIIVKKIVPADGPVIVNFAEEVNKANKEAGTPNKDTNKPGSFIVKIKQEPQEEPEVENGADMEKELAAATRAVMTAITPTVVDESDAKVRGESLSPGKLANLDRTSREAEIMAAIKKLKGTIASGGPGAKKIVVTIPSKLKEEEDSEDGLAAGKKRPKKSLPMTRPEELKIKQEEVVEIIEDEEETAKADGH